MSYAQFFLTKLKRVGRADYYKLKIDPQSVSGACLRPLYYGSLCIIIITFK